MTKDFTSPDYKRRSRSRSRSSHHCHNRHSHHHHSRNREKSSLTNQKWEHKEERDNQNKITLPIQKPQNNSYLPLNMSFTPIPFIETIEPPPPPPPPLIPPVIPPQTTILPTRNTSPTLIIDNIPYNWKYEEIIQFFLCFGKLSGITLKYDSKHQFNGCALVKYEKLIQSNYFSYKMNNFIFLNKEKDENDFVLEISELKSDIFTPESISENIKIPVTNVIRIENLVTKEILNSVTDFNDFIIDLKEECENYGKIIKYVIPRNKQQGGYGYIFINYMNGESAKSAYESLDKTEANGSIVNIMYYPLFLFEKEIYGSNLFDR